MALSSSSDYSLTPTQDLYDTGRRNALLSDVGFSAALLSAGVAVVVYFADRRGAAPAPAHEAAPARAHAFRWDLVKGSLSVEGARGAVVRVAVAVVVSK